MGRYLLYLVLLFVLYWTFKGTLRRLFAPPARRKRRVPSNAPTGERVEARSRPTPGIDYSKVKDADYRDL